jgi:hypothetical protein
MAPRILPRDQPDERMEPEIISCPGCRRCELGDPRTEMPTTRLLGVFEVMSGESGQRIPPEEAPDKAAQCGVSERRPRGCGVDQSQTRHSILPTGAVVVVYGISEESYH